MKSSDELRLRCQNPCRLQSESYSNRLFLVDLKNINSPTLHFNKSFSKFPHHVEGWLTSILQITFNKRQTQHWSFNPYDEKANEMKTYFHILCNLKSFLFSKIYLSFCWFMKLFHFMTLHMKPDCQNSLQGLMLVGSSSQNGILFSKNFRCLNKLR